MKKQFSLSLIVTALLLTSSTVFASSYTDSLSSKEANALNNPSSVKSKTAKAEVSKNISNENFLAKAKAGVFKNESNADETKRFSSIVHKALKAHENSLKKASKDFKIGLNDTVMSLKAIRMGKVDEAQKLLDKADKGFAVAFKKEPKLGLIPVVDDAEVISFNGSPELINHIKKSAIKLLKDNDIQAAVDILLPLQDEIIMKTQYVPAYLYPIAVKEAQKELKAGDKEAAFATIVTALQASQLEVVTLPIPLLTAQDMVLQASGVEKSHKKEALGLLVMAQDELKKAVALGYTKKNEKAYKNIETKIEKIKTEIKGKNRVVKLYDDVLKDFKNLSSKDTH